MRLRYRVITAVAFVAVYSVTAAKSAFGEVGDETQPVMPVSFTSLLEQPARSPDRVMPYSDTALNTTAVFDSALESTKATVILVHGGCWLSAYSREHTYPMASALAARGFDVRVPEYRRTGDVDGGWPQTSLDVNAAVASAVADVAGERPVVLLGHSAGGHLALLSAMEQRTDLTAVVGLAAITDIEEYAEGAGSCQQAAREFMGGPPADNADQYALATPRLEGEAPPIFLVRGTNDPIVGGEQMVTGWAATPVAIEGAGHFDLIHPQTAAFTEVVNLIESLLE